MAARSTHDDTSHDDVSFLFGGYFPGILFIFFSVCVCVCVCVCIFKVKGDRTGESHPVHLVLL